MSESVRTVAIAAATQPKKSRMKTINRSQLVDLLAGIQSPTPIGIVALTDTRARKTGNPFAQVFKLSRVWPMTATDYARAVNAQLAREGSPAEFVPLSPRYTRLSPALVQYVNTGTFAIPVQFNSQRVQAAKPRFFARVARLAPLRPVSRETVAPFMDKADEPARQVEAGIVNPVYWRTYGVDSVLRLSLGGEVYRIRG